LQAEIKTPNLFSLFCLGQISLWAVQFTVPTFFSPFGAVLAGCAMGFSSASLVRSLILCASVGLCSAFLHVVSPLEAAIILPAGALVFFLKTRWSKSRRPVPWILLGMFAAAFFLTMTGLKGTEDDIPLNVGIVHSMNDGASFPAAIKMVHDSPEVLRPLPTVFPLWCFLAKHGVPISLVYSLLCLLILLMSFLIARKCFGEETSLYSPLILAPCLLSSQWSGGYADIEKWGTVLIMISVYSYLNGGELISALYFSLALCLKETFLPCLLGPLWASFRTSKFLPWALAVIPVGIIWAFQTTHFAALGISNFPGWHNSLNMGTEPFRMLWVHCAGHAGEFHIFFPAGFILGLLGLVIGTRGHNRLFVLGIFLGEVLGFFLISAPIFFRAFLAVMPLVISFAPGVAVVFTKSRKKAEVVVLEKKVYR
jgi:hypothetical protein